MYKPTLFFSLGLLPLLLLIQAQFVLADDVDPRELGRRMFLEGVLPSGKSMTAYIQGDVKVTGEQVRCGACHRRSGMGSSEGQQVVPAVTGKLLYNPLRIPTSRPPAAPTLRPAYDDETLKAALLRGVDANGAALDPNMPRYLLTEGELDVLLEYLKGLSSEPSPGVTETEVHFATIVSDRLPKADRKALLDVMRVFFQQKNTETRYESKRSANPPWHKKWIMGNYRKWRHHVWELKGEESTWPEQLAAHYRSQPVFAVISGAVNGDWRPIHDYCEAEQLPCLFPTTDLPVDSDQDFYSLYFSRGVILEGEGVARYLLNAEPERKKIVQLYNGTDRLSKSAAEAFAAQLEKAGVVITSIDVDAGDGDVDAISAKGRPGSVAVLWLSHEALQPYQPWLEGKNGPEQIYLSTTLYRDRASSLPEGLKEKTRFVHPHELPSRMRRLLVRSTGWFRAKRIYASDHQRIQANAFFALKAAGDAMTHIRGYFFRDYFIERIEHMVDNAPYTSVYPRISLAPGQRFLSKGYYIARVAAGERGRLVPLMEWGTP
ncbi:MAG: hypothetical protein JMN26_04130 [gamma proteobacterium endosymbiont of Lamellibrachia anaximandri]|nr:hypothetical protein [gamma proteobacterium endosymbiont of Lamellibrachia anaximandri]